MCPAIYSITTELLDAIKSLPLHERAGTIPISLDIVSMYTNIPIDDGIQTVLEYLQRYNSNLFGLSLLNIKSLLTFMLNNNIFTFKKKYYHQFSGLAIGSRIAPVIAIIILDRIERQVLQTHSYLAIKLFRR